MEVLFLTLSDIKIASLLQLLIVLFMIFSILDFLITGFISQYSNISLKYGLFFNYFLFDNNNFSKLINSMKIPIWGPFQFFIYCLIIIFMLQLWKIFRTEKDSNLRAFKFNAIFSFFIILLSLTGALILSYTGIAANGLYTMNIFYIRIVIVLLLINILFSSITIVKVFSSK